MNFKHLALSAAALVFTTASYATPHYLGSTTVAPSDIEYLSHGADSGYVPVIGDAGYYIWSNESKTDWSVRWTGDGGNYDFLGNIIVEAGNNLDAASISKVAWETGDGSVTSSIGEDWGTFDKITFGIGQAGGGWDGFNFSVSESTTFVTFRLGSDMLTSGDFSGCSADCDSIGIFLGTNSDGTWGQPDVDVVEYTSGPIQGYVQQSFTVQLPEPSVLALFGLGLAGLGFAARKKKQA